MQYIIEYLIIINKKLSKDKYVKQKKSNSCLQYPNMELIFGILRIIVNRIFVVYLHHFEIL